MLPPPDPHLSQGVRVVQVGPSYMILVPCGPNEMIDGKLLDEELRDAGYELTPDWELDWNLVESGGRTYAETPVREIRGRLTTTNNRETEEVA